MLSNMFLYYNLDLLFILKLVKNSILFCLLLITFKFAQMMDPHPLQYYTDKQVFL